MRTPAIGYIRVSLAREDMISPDIQRSSIEQWAARTQHRIVDWVEDLDKTGRNFKRKIMSVIERVEAGEVRTIAVWKYSRFGRTRTGVPANLARVEKAGGQLLSATEEVDARTAIGRFQRGMIMEFNAFESDRAGEQWVETHQWRRDHGLPAMGRPRFGYIWHQRKIYSPDGSVTLQEERYEPDADKGKVVAELYRAYNAGASFRSLALGLNDAGHRTVRGDLWTGRAVKRYLDSGFPAGYLRFHQKTCPQGSVQHDCSNYELVRHPTLHHPAIITDEIWRQYQERRAFTMTAAPRARTAAYPLTGLVRCGRCSRRAHRKVDGRKTAVYACHGRELRGPHACHGTSLVDHAIEKAIREFLLKVVDDVEAAAAMQAAPLPRQLGRSLPEQKREKLEGELAKWERTISRHMRAYALADDDATGELEKEYLATLKDLRAAKGRTVAELKALRSEMDGGPADGGRGAAVAVAIGLLEEWDSLGPSQLNVLLRRVIDRVELLGNRQSRVVPIWEKA